MWAFGLNVIGPPIKLPVEAGSTIAATSLMAACEKSRHLTLPTNRQPHPGFALVTSLCLPLRSARRNSA